MLIKLVENPEIPGCYICLLIAGFLKRIYYTCERDGVLGMKEATLTAAGRLILLY